MVRAFCDLDNDGNGSLDPEETRLLFSGLGYSGAELAAALAEIERPGERDNKVSQY